MVPLSMRDWRVCLSLPSNIILSCFQPVWEVISFLSIDVEGFQVVYDPGIEEHSSPDGGN